LPKAVSEQTTETKNLLVSTTKEIIAEDPLTQTGERKHVTVLFADLSGYTAMSEMLDPEEVK
jgi:class 3 adenylate cyclase